jgi:hypothetical protein
MAKYQTTVDCFFDGQLYPAGSIFEGRKLEGYDKETADYLTVLDEPEAPAADLSKLKKDELIALAEVRGVVIPADATKAGIVELLNEAEEL